MATEKQIAFIYDQQQATFSVLPQGYVTSPALYPNTALQKLHHFDTNPATYCILSCWSDRTVE